MKTNNIIAFTLTLLVTSACGKIPAAYQGKFIDQSTGTQMELKDSEGTLTQVNGVVMASKALALSFDALNKGETGIYLRSSQSNKDLLEVFWVVPDLSSAQTEAGFTVMNAEILYTKMDTKEKNKVQTLELLHCKEGKILLDQPSKQWNGGCPIGSSNYQMQRSAR